MRNLFWEYSLATYQRKGVAEECLRAQNALSLDVNQLLYASWLASIDQQLSFAHLNGLEAAVRDWRERVVLPLRHLRQQLKGFSPASDIRESVKGLELQAEQEQQDMMWRYYLLAPALSVASRPLQENLALLFESTGCERERWLPVMPYLLSVLRSPRS
jgi:uncharacterized protein (TIGR02444 family)